MLNLSFFLPSLLAALPKLSIINVDGFVDSLWVMLLGMIGIFVVIGVILLIVVLLGKIFPGDSNAKKAKKDAAADQDAS